MPDFVTHRRVEFADTDLSGIVHFSRFLVFMETAEHQFRSFLGFDVHTESDGRAIGWPRVSAGCDYKSPLRFGDDVTISARVERLGRTSLTFHFTLSVGDRVAAEGRLTSVCCVLGGDRLELIPIPDDLVDRIERFEGGRHE